MPASGKHDKMLILAFNDSEAAENGGLAESDAHFEALINPETYTLSYQLKFSNQGQGQGSSGRQLKYAYSEPAEMSFEFLFDNTGIIDGKPRDSIADDLKQFKDVLIDYKGDTHEPRHFKLVWGESSIYKGRVTAVDIVYKLFKSDGTPLRATAKVTFKSSIEEAKRAAQENRQSPDLTHVRRIKRGETLPLLCQQIYGDPRYYLQVAARNGLENFRQLEPGQTLHFPPVDKTPGTTPTEAT